MPSYIQHSNSDHQFLKKVGRKINEVRLQMGYTQSQLAEQAGVSIQMVQYWESGRNITLRTLYNLAYQLGCPVRSFFKEPRNMTAQRGRPRTTGGKTKKPKSREENKPRRIPQS